MTDNLAEWTAPPREEFTQSMKLTEPKR